MIVWGSAVAALASGAGLMTLGASDMLGELLAMTFAVSVFVMVCTVEASL